MFKKKLMTTASAVVVACGAMTIAAGSAQAGQLKVKMADVNIQCNDYEVHTQHFDTDCYGVDVNGNVGPNQGPTEHRSIDKGFIDIIKPEGTFSHIAIADEREINEVTPASGLFEVDLFEIEDGATFTPTIKVEINLSGDSDPWFKEDQNCIDVLRAGTDNVFSQSAFKDDLAVEPDGGIQADKNRAVCYIRTTESGATAPDSAIGFALPIKMKHCGDMFIELTVTRFIEGVGPIGTETTSHQFVECRDSLHSDSGYYPTKIDYFHNFRTFLVDPNPHDNIEVHEPSLWATTGALHFDIWHYLTDLKYEFGDNKTAEENVFDVSDIDSYELVVQFDDLTGIEGFALGGMYASLNRVNNTASWYLTEEQFASKFCLGDSERIKGSGDYGCTQPFTIHAYGKDYYGDYWGPIDHQELVITKSKFYFDDYETNNQPHPVPFLAYETEQEGALVGHLVKTGIIFGAFDWVADATKPVRSWFRLTGIPDTYADQLKGHITIENASAGHEYEGDYKVDFTPYVENWEMLVSINDLSEMLVSGGLPDAEFGRADVTFTIYVPGREGIKMDMDRLLYTNGVFADYGDNANDGASLKARSCDDGRFGPHVANKLDPYFKYLLVGICNLGELDRSINP